MNSLASPRLHLALVATMFGLAGAQAAHAASPQGIWLDSAGRGAVEIKPCGAALCGHVVWVKNAADSKGCGRQIIGDATKSGGTYQGWIYSPEDRKRYNVDLSAASDGRLKVVGYAGIRLFSKTMYWKPAAPDLVRCDAPAATKAPAPDSAKASPPAADKQAAVAVPSSPTAQAKDVTATKESGPTPPKPQASAAVEAAPPAAAPPAATAEEAQPEDDVASSSEDDGAAAGKPSLDKLARVIDKVVKRTPGGGCKLDLPWVKVEFNCED